MRNSKSCVPLVYLKCNYLEHTAYLAPRMKRENIFLNLCFEFIGALLLYALRVQRIVLLPNLQSSIDTSAKLVLILFLRLALKTTN